MPELTGPHQQRDPRDAKVEDALAAITPLQLLACADLLLLSADLLRPPGERRIDEIDAEALPDLCQRTGLSDAPAMQQALLEVLAAWRGETADALSDEYHRLFEGAIACPINETAYIRRDKGALIGDMCGFYRAFGFAPKAAIGDKPDHLVTQLEFLALLCTMLAVARDPNAPADACEVTASAMRKFAADHTHDWILSACSRLTEVTASPYYLAAALTIAGIWQRMADAWGLPAQTDLPPWQEPPESGNAFECGDEPEAHGLVPLGVRAPAPPATAARR